ncbi:SHOCT domain-containing protein [Rhodococcus sp. NPDC003318]
MPWSSRKLAELRDAGIVTEAEFEAKKRNLLDRM